MFKHRIFKHILSKELLSLTIVSIYPSLVHASNSEQEIEALWKTIEQLQQKVAEAEEWGNCGGRFGIFIPNSKLDLGLSWRQVKRLNLRPHTLLITRLRYLKTTIQTFHQRTRTTKQLKRSNPHLIN